MLQYALSFWRYLRKYVSTSRIRDCYATCRVRMGCPVVTVVTDAGRIVVDLRDSGVGRPLFLNKIWDIGETAFLRRTLKPGDLFVDVGANVGYYTILAAHSVGPSGQVYAFEPEPYNYSLLQQTVTANMMRNIQTFQVALSDQSGFLALYKSDYNYGDHRFAITNQEQARLATEVPVTTLDSFFCNVTQNRAIVIKMDVQGYEPKVIRGMKMLLSNARKIVIVAEFCPTLIERSGESIQEFLNNMKSLNLMAFLIANDGQVTPLAYDDIISSMPYWESSTGPFLNIVFKSNL